MNPIGPSIETFEADDHPREKSPISAEQLLLQKEIEIELTKTIESAREKTKQYLTQQLIKDAKKNPDDVDFDHYLLALGDVKLGRNSFVEAQLSRRFVRRQKGNGKLTFDDALHQGAISYSLLVSGSSPQKKIPIRGGKSVAVQELIDYPLTHIENPDLADVEWITLLAIDALRKGRQIELKQKDGSEISLERLVAICENEFNFVHHKEKLKEPQFSNPLNGSCQGTHALQALLSYALLKDQPEKITEYLNFVFSKLDELTANPNNLTGELFIHPISHWLMILCELPANFEFTVEQRTSIKTALFRMSQETEKYIQKLQKSVPNPNISSMAHVQDVFNRIPATFWK